MNELPEPPLAVAGRAVPRVANAVIGMFIGCFVTDVVTNGMLYTGGLLIPGLLFEGEWERLFYAGLLHGDLIDLVVNLALAFAAVPAVERLFGRARTATALAISAVAAGVLSAAVLPSEAVASASGAVFGAIGLLLGVIVFRGGVLSEIVESRMVFVLGAGIFAEAGVGLLSSYVNNVMHLGGLLAGILLSCVLEPELPGFERRPWLGALYAPLLVLGLGVGLVYAEQRSVTTLTTETLRASEDFELGWLDRATTRMEHALNLPPRGSADQMFLPTAQNQLAWFYVKARRNIRKGIALSEESNRLMEQQPALLDTLGYLYALAGDCRRAADAMGRAADLDAAYVKRRDEVNRACQAGQPPDPDLPVEAPPKLPAMPPGRGIRV